MTSIKGQMDLFYASDMLIYIIHSCTMSFPTSIIFKVENLLLMIQVGKLSTGDSLDMCPQDEAAIVANDATVKDMEVTFTSQICLYWFPAAIS